jgi:Antibiotic biosynthesis monooxygenase
MPSMLQLKALDPSTPIFQQPASGISPMLLLNTFQVEDEDIPALLSSWELEALWMKQQPGYISTQLHQGIGGSTVFMNYAIWESVKPALREHLFTRVTRPTCSGTI